MGMCMGVQETKIFVGFPSGGEPKHLESYTAW